MEENNFNNDLQQEPFNEDFYKTGQRVELAPRSRLVFVTGILFVILGSLALIQSGSAIMSSDYVVKQFGKLLNPEGIAQMQRIMPIVNIFGLISAIVEVAAGIAGIIYCRKPEKAFLIIAFGILIIGIVLINSFVVGKIMNNVITSFISDEFMDAQRIAVVTMKVAGWVGTFIGLVLPVLYLIGGFVLKKRRDAAESL